MDSIWMDEVNGVIEREATHKLDERFSFFFRTHLSTNYQVDTTSSFANIYSISFCDHFFQWWVLTCFVKIHPVMLILSRRKKEKEGRICMPSSPNYFNVVHSFSISSFSLLSISFSLIFSIPSLPTYIFPHFSLILFNSQFMVLSI